MPVNRTGPVPISQQIADGLRQMIVTGVLVPGDQLPSGPQLATEEGVTVRTARKAVNILVAEGLVQVVQGMGAYVAGQAA